MSDAFDIASQVNGYGAPGATAFFGVQQELMRRAQLKLEAEQRAEALARQHAQDQLHTEQVQQEIAASKANVASNEESRAASAALRTQQTAAAGLKDVTSVLHPGQSVTDEEYKAAVDKVGAGNAALLFGVTPAKPGSTSYDDATAQVQTTPDVPASRVYKGTDAQRTDEERKAEAQKVIDGYYDTGNDSVDLVEKARARHYLQTGKEANATDLAAILKAQAKPTADETNAAHNHKLEEILSRPQSSWTPDEARMVEGRKAFNKMQGAEAAARLNVTVTNANARQDKTLDNSAVQHELDSVQKKMDALKLPQAANLIETLSSPGGVNDVVAVPEFLSAMAGGVGRGLRMSQAELNMIQKARPGIESLGIKLKNLAMNYTALTQEQRDAMMKLTRSIADRENKLRDIYMLTRAKVTEAKTPTDARRYVNQMDQLESDLYKGLLTPPAASDAAEGGAVVPPVVNPRVSGQF